MARKIHGRGSWYASLIKDKLLQTLMQFYKQKAIMGNRRLGETFILCFVEEQQVETLPSYQAGASISPAIVLIECIMKVYFVITEIVVDLGTTSADIRCSNGGTEHIGITGETTSCHLSWTDWLEMIFTENGFQQRYLVPKHSPH